jgi:hypothetical protein
LSDILAFPFAPQGAGARLRALCGSHVFDCIGIVEGNQMNLKSMSIDRLTDLRHRVEAALARLSISGGRSNPNSQNSIGSRAKRREKLAPGSE